MHILSPAYSAKEVPLLLHAGADWLYTEWVPEWKEMVQKRVPPPTCAVSALFAPSRIEEVEQIVQAAHHGKALLFLKLGASYYTAEDHRSLSSLLAQALEAKVDGFIFSDIGLLPLLAEMQPRSLLIGGPDIYLGNARSLELLAKAGATHVILAPRCSLAELAELVRRGPAQLDYGCLIFNGSYGHCFYDPSLCNTVHAGKNFCDWDLEYLVTTYGSEGVDLNYAQCRQLKENEYWQRLWLYPFSYFAAHMVDWRGTGCGLCALPFWGARPEIRFIQVGGGHHDFTRRLMATELVQRALGLVAQGAGPAQVRDHFRATQPHGELCDLTYRCLYPDASDHPSQGECNENTRAL